MFGSALVLGACGTTGADDAEAGEDGVTSNDANVVEMSFDGTVIAEGGAHARTAITTQLRYLQGVFTTDLRGNAMAAMPSLADIKEQPEGDLLRITYSAKVTVALPKRKAAPERYEIVVPLDSTKFDDFNRKYDGRCGKNKYGQDTFWNDWNPKAEGCTPDGGDVHRATATFKPHPQKTEGKYPEYDKVWEDNALDVVAVFGIIESFTPSDQALKTREDLLRAATRGLRNATRVEAPAAQGILADSTVSGTLSIGGSEKRVNVTGILVHAVAGAGPAFDERFATLSEKADLVMYEGHSGLGKNIEALATNMGATAGKYQLLYLYGCQTLGSLPPALHEKRIALNGAAKDPEGTKFLDVIALALPAYSDAGYSTVALFNTLLEPTEPKSFKSILTGISSLHLAVVLGEHDNTFTP